MDNNAKFLTGLFIFLMTLLYVIFTTMTSNIERDSQIEYWCSWFLSKSENDICKLYWENISDKKEWIYDSEYNECISINKNWDIDRQDFKISKSWNEEKCISEWKNLRQLDKLK